MFVICVRRMVVEGSGKGSTWRVGCVVGGCNLLLSTADMVVMGFLTTLSLASAHGHLQLKHQNQGWTVCMEEVLEWFNYPRVSTHPRCEVSCQGVLNRPASSLHPCYIKGSLMVEKAVSG